MVAMASSGATVAAESSRSAPPAGRLQQALQERRMHYVAARAPGEEGRYLAAMLVGEGQLLVVSARYAQPALMNERLYRGDHEGVYRELNAAGERDGRLFVQDLGLPGLHATRKDGEPFDMIYEAVVKGTAFNGDWKAQKLSKDDYRDTYDAADVRYARALEALLVSLEDSTATTAKR
ncbi:MAG: hypothetical protein ABIU38_13200 [Vicinamibacteraceae bacterium]